MLWSINKIISPRPQRRGVISRILNYETGIENNVFRKGQFVEATLDLQTWVLFVFAVASNAPNGGLTTSQVIIIRSAGFSTLQTTLIQMPSGGVQMTVCCGAC